MPFQGSFTEVSTQHLFTPPPPFVPSDADLQRAADILNAGKKVAILVGMGAKHAADEVMEVADLLGCGVAKALLGKQVLPDDLPFVTGCIGLLGTKPSYDMMMGCDTLLMIGSIFPYGQFLPKEGQARGIQIDIDGRNLSLRYPMELNLIGDSTETLCALIPYLQRKTDHSWREKIESDYHDWWKVVEARAMEEADPLNPDASSGSFRSGLLRSVFSVVMLVPRPTGMVVSLKCAVA